MEVYTVLSAAIRISQIHLLQWLEAATMLVTGQDPVCKAVGGLLAIRIF